MIADGIQYPSTLLENDPDSISIDVKPPHPTVPQIWVLWTVYTENVDPLYKIFHVPSFHKQLLKAVQEDLQDMDADAETLLFAVYFAATVSLTEEECLEKFNEKRILSLKRHRYGLEQCLFHSKFLDTTPRITTLQAFVLYITMARDAPISVPTDTLLAIAVRLATKLGLHQDLTCTQPMGFTTLADRTALESHRRLWWHILSLDVQIAEDAGTDPTILDCTWNTRIPENMDDAELDAHSNLPLPSRPGQTFDPEYYAIQSILNDYTTTEDSQRRTDMTYVLARMEISHALRRLNFSENFCEINGSEYLSTRTSRLKFLDDLARNLNRKYTKYCQRSDFFSFLVRNATNLILSKYVMLSKRSESSAPETLRNCAKILEAAVGLRKTQPKWAWSLRADVELCVLNVLLQVLVEIPAGSENGENEMLMRHYRLLVHAAVERGREHGLKSCYLGLWDKIEEGWKIIEDRGG